MKLLEDGKSVLPNWLGKVWGSGHCAVLVQTATHAPLTAFWAKGAKVKGNAEIKAGTAIATFGTSGKYLNNTKGLSHAAVYLNQDAHGIQVMDQWVGHSCNLRTIYYKHPVPVMPCNDGNEFYVIEHASTKEGT